MSSRIQAIILVTALMSGCNGELNDRADNLNDRADSADASVAALTARMDAIESANAAKASQISALQSANASLASTVGALDSQLQGLEAIALETGVSNAAHDLYLRMHHEELRFVFDGAARYMGRLDGVGWDGFSYVDPDVAQPIFAPTAGPPSGGQLLYSGPNCTGAVAMQTALAGPQYALLLRPEATVYTVASVMSPFSIASVRNFAIDSPCSASSGSGSYFALTVVKTYSPFTPGVSFGVSDFAAVH